MLLKILYWVPLSVGLLYALVTGAMVIYVSMASLAIAFLSTYQLFDLCIEEAAIINLLPMVKNVCMKVSPQAYVDLVKAVVHDAKAEMLYNLTKF